MKLTIHAGLLALCGAALSAALPPAYAEDLNVERLATCQESWLDWKGDKARIDRMSKILRTDYVQKEAAVPYLAPKKSKSAFGFPLAQLYPDSLGSAVGFSALMSGDFDAIRRRVEKITGKPLQQCADSGGAKSCQVELAPKKTLVLLGNDQGKATLVGCAYYPQQRQTGEQYPK